MNDKTKNIMIEIIVLLIMCSIGGALLGGIFFIFGGDFFGVFKNTFIILFILFVVGTFTSKKEEKDSAKALNNTDYDELKELCDMCDSFESKINIIADSKIKFYSKIAKFILDSSNSTRESLEKVQILVEHKLLTNKDLNESREFICADRAMAQSAMRRREVINRASPQKSKKEIIKENKKQGIACCPKCGSTSITATNKKLSVTRGVVGGAIGSVVNPLGTAVGAVAGGLSSKKVYCVCMNCGHRWKP